MKILVIEDSLFLRRTIEKVLQNSGHEVISAADGHTGLQAARTTVPHMILLDIMLPMLEGTRVLQELKRDALTAEIPVVVLSSLYQKNGERLKKDGASAYIEKSTLDLETNADPLLQVIEKVAGELSQLHSA
ncbi:MAG: response regulator [Terriglobales bacterium]